MNTRRSASRLQAVLSHALGIAVLVGMVVYFARLGQGEPLADLLVRASPLAMGVALAGAALGQVLFSVAQVALARSLNVQLGYAESFALGVVARAGNVFTPVHAGTVYRGAYFKTAHEMPVARFGSMLIGSQALHVLAACLAGSTALVGLWIAREQTSLALLAFMGGGGGLALLLVFLSRPVSEPRGWFPYRVAVMRNGLHSLLRNRTTSTVVIACRLLGLAAATVVYYVLLSELGAQPGWLVCIVVAATASLSMLVGLVPGGLGVTELVVTLLANLLAVPSGVAFAAALLIRICAVVFLALAVLPSWLWLSRRDQRGHPAADG